MLIIPNYICTKVYNIDSPPYSLSFITDVKNNKEYILKGGISNLWEFIVNSKDYDLICKFAINNKLDNILDDFLFQLKQKKLICTDLNFLSENSVNLLPAIYFNSENYSYYINYKNNFLLKYKFIENLYLVLNYRCNLNCRHCCNPKNMDQFFISFEQAKKIIDEAVELGVSEILVTGGECTLNKDFLNIVKYIKSKYLRLVIFSNGQNFYDNEDLFNSIVDIYPSLIQFSLYSTNPQVHDNMTRVSGSHHKTLSVLKKFKQAGINVGIINFQSTYNKNSYAELKKFADSLKINCDTGCSFIYNKDNNNLDAALSEEDMVKYYTRRYPTLLDLEQKYKKFKKSDKKICQAGYNLISVEPDLSVTPCSYAKYSLGNLKNTTLKHIKENALPQFLKLYTTENLKECFNHDYCQYCYYCLMNTTLNKGFLKKDEMLCRDARAIQKTFLLHQQNKSCTLH